MTNEKAPNTNVRGEDIGDSGAIPSAVWTLTTNSIYNGIDTIIVPAAGSLYANLSYLDGVPTPLVGIYTQDGEWKPFVRGQNFTSVQAGDSIYVELSQPDVDTITLEFQLTV